jgi:hypothetical protein
MVVDFLPRPFGRDATHRASVVGVLDDDVEARGPSAVPRDAVICCVAVGVTDTSACRTNSSEEYHVSVPDSQG